MSGHTTGPWRINRGERMLNQWGVGKDLYTCMVTAETPIAAIVHDGHPKEAAEANAKLIAAAPELLAALKLYELVWSEMFAHFLSNRVLNQWGKEFDCTTLNVAHHEASQVLRKLGDQS